MSTTFIATVHNENAEIDLSDVLFSGSVYRTLESAKIGAQGYEDDCAEEFGEETEQLEWSETDESTWEAGSQGGNRHMIREVKVMGD